MTPPPGVATFGYALDARVASGYWTRLECRAFVFVPEIGGTPVALVPCELAAISTLLQRRVVEMLRAEGVEIPPQRLFISAVHTHAGPAHYFNGEYYGGMASSHGPGFDPQVLDFLAERIARATKDAYLAATRRRDASPPRPVQLRWIHGKHWGLTHNRSLAAFTLNHDLMDPGQPPAEIAGSLEPSARAIDPNLDILELIEDSPDKCRETIGWIGLFAMHPTVMPSKGHLFGGDAFGVTSRLLEQELRREAAAQECSKSRPLVGLINTNEGDLVPRWSTGDRGETITIGKRLAEAFLKVHADFANVPRQSQPALAASYLEVELPGNRYGLPPGQQLCDRAELGLSAIYGAADHPSSIAEVAELAGPNRDELRCDCQRPKRPALGFLQSLTSGEFAFPTTVPLGLLRLDDTFIGFVPAEVTTMTGSRIRGAITSAVGGQDGGRPVVSRIGGLTNGYIEYVATHEEYALQRYEGGSTLYGAMTEPFLAATFHNMANRLVGKPTPAPPGTRPDVAGDFAYGTGPKRSRLPIEPYAFVTPRAIELCQIAASRVNGPPSYCFTYESGHPDLSTMPPARTVSLVAVKEPWKPLTLHVRLSNGLAASTVADPLLQLGPSLISDDGFEFVTAVHERTTRGWLWTTLFTPTTEEWEHLRSEPTQFAFSIGGASGPGVFRSAPFTFVGSKLAPRACTIESARRCGALE